MSNENIAENKVIIKKNGDAKTLFTEDVKNNGGWVSVEESIRLIKEGIKKIYEDPRF